MDSGQQAANQFYQLLQARHPIARQRLAEIIVLARQGDPEAIRAIRLIQSVMASPVQVGAVAPKPVVTPQQIEMIRQILVSARYAPPSAMQAPAGKAPAGKAPTPQAPPGLLPDLPNLPTPPAPSSAVFTQIPGGIVGFMGEGIYQVTKPEGLGLFSGPTMNQPAIQILPGGSLVRVFAQGGNSYVQVDQPAPGYVCMSCSEVPGGPWLIRKS